MKETETRKFQLASFIAPSYPWNKVTFFFDMHFEEKLEVQLFPTVEEAIPSFVY